jgi:hypothetical protein
VVDSLALSHPQLIKSRDSEENDITLGDVTFGGVHSTAAVCDRIRDHTRRQADIHRQVMEVVTEAQR